MILGELEIDETIGLLHAPRTSYTLKNVSVSGVTQPLLPSALIFSAGAAATGISFFNVLQTHERISIAIFVILALVFGWSAGRLKLRSKELRSGDELADAVWGSFSALNKKRRDIIRAAAATRAGTAQ